MPKKMLYGVGTGLSLVIAIYAGLRIINAQRPRKVAPLVVVGTEPTPAPAAFADCGYRAENVWKAAHYECRAAREREVCKDDAGGHDCVTIRMAEAGGYTPESWPDAVRRCLDAGADLHLEVGMLQ